MKHLFRQFIHDVRDYEDENIHDETQPTNPQEVKIPAIQLFDELGKLFDRELRQSVMNAKNGKDANGNRALPYEEEDIQHSDNLMTQA